jgi:hypothetical protein
MDDAEARLRRRECALERRAKLDAELVARFAQRIRQSFPGCPGEPRGAHCWARM